MHININKQKSLIGSTSRLSDVFCIPQRTQQTCIPQV